MVASSGLLFYGACGEKLVQKVISSGNGKLPYYICNRKKKAKDCASHSVERVTVSENGSLELQFRFAD